MEAQDQQLISDMQSAYQDERNKRLQAESNQVATMFHSEENENLIKFQLDIKEEMERIEHLLRKHVPKIDSQGNLTYESPKKRVLACVYKDTEGLKFYLESEDGRILKVVDTKHKKAIFGYGDSSLGIQRIYNMRMGQNALFFLRYKEIEIQEALFNETGVKEILNLLAWYLNKTIILSDFDEEEINLRVWQFGKELNNFIYNNYENFGLDNPEKIKHYPITVMNIVNIVEAAYHRALYGKERDSLRSARVVSQSENLNQQNTYPQAKNSSNKFSLLKPSTW